MSEYRLLLGDCLEQMKTLEANSIDAIVTDPPYGLVEPRSGGNGTGQMWATRTDDTKEKRRGGFMGKGWDHAVPGVLFWAEMLRVAKPGAHLLAFGGDRTHHRMMCAIEDAGWELRTCLYWAFGSGFPKSHDVSKAIDRMAGAERPSRQAIDSQDGGPGWVLSGSKERCSVCGKQYFSGNPCRCPKLDAIPATDAAKQWLGWGSALKPSVEIIVMARKPLSEPTIAANVLKHGTGALNIDGCRIGYVDEGDKASATPQGRCVWKPGRLAGDADGVEAQDGKRSPQLGRWPANLLLDDQAAALLDEMSGELKPGGSRANRQTGQIFVHGGAHTQYDNGGGASRFFYVAKASKRDRDEGLEGMPERVELIGAAGHKMNPMTGKPVVDLPRKNGHPCVKPQKLMSWLVKLICPPGGTVLDPFMGSGSTGKACMLEGFDFVGVELDEEYLAIARARIEHALAGALRARRLELAAAQMPLFAEGVL